MEKYIENPRHIEFQVLGDRHGRVIHLGERECSIQRRHQKLIEEAPSPAVDAETREAMGARVASALEKIGYSGAGTVEFLRDARGDFYFIEMNTRIQVEHPVTEAVTSVDLIKAQIRLAAGERIEEVVPRVEFRGHSMECRINAEDPETFAPSPGRITAFHFPGGHGVRVDTAMYSDAVVPPYYDSLIAKLIVHATDRPEAVARMRRALEMFVIEGVKTTIPLHRRIMDDPRFQQGDLDTSFLDHLLETAAR
jgi:acetyl-CoA carboxylase, biotin carboxylase subunit